MFSSQSSFETFEDTDASYVQFINLDPPFLPPLPQLHSISYPGRSLAKTKLLLKRENAKQRILMKKDVLQEYEKNLEDSTRLLPIQTNSLTCLLKNQQIELKKENDSCQQNKVGIIGNSWETQKISMQSLKLSGQEDIEEGRSEVNKERKKVIQKIRNRVSAQMSRDKKKIYLEGLEKENRQLKEKIALLESSQRSIKMEETKSVNNSQIFNAGVIRFSFIVITMVFLMFTVKKGDNIEGFNSKGLMEFLNLKPFENLEKVRELIDQDQNQFYEIAQKTKLEKMGELMENELYLYYIYFVLFYF